jgi:hypothetical protein
MPLIDQVSPFDQDESAKKDIYHAVFRMRQLVDAVFLAVRDAAHAADAFSTSWGGVLSGLSSEEKAAITIANLGDPKQPTQQGAFAVNWNDAAAAQYKDAAQVSLADLEALVALAVTLATAVETNKAAVYRARG